MVATPGSLDRRGWCCLAERSAEDQEAIEVTARKKDWQAGRILEVKMSNS